MMFLPHISKSETNGNGDGRQSPIETELPFHELTEMFPLLEGEPFEELVADIREHGLQVSILTHEGQIVDGRNRYRACRQAGVEPRYYQWHGRGSLVAYVIALNLHRRHLSASQLAMVSLRVLPLIQKEAKQRSRQGKKTDPAVTGRSEELAGKIVGVSRCSVKAARNVQQNGVPQLAEAVRDGRVSVSDAASIVKEPPAKQRQALSEVRKGQARNLKSAVAKNPQSRQSKAKAGKSFTVENLDSLAHELTCRAESIRRLADELRGNGIPEITLTRYVEAAGAPQVLDGFIGHCRKVMRVMASSSTDDISHSNNLLEKDLK